MEMVKVQLTEQVPALRQKDLHLHQELQEIREPRTELLELTPGCGTGEPWREPSVSTRTAGRRKPGDDPKTEATHRHPQPRDPKEK